MLSLYRHQRIETLATLLEEKLDEELRGSDAFYQPTIAVGSQAMERFVSEHLARRFGVASNLRFMRPAELIHRLVEERLNRSIEGLRAWDPSSLRFAILAELPHLQELASRDELPEAAFLESYLPQKEGAVQSRRALLLATDLADILDRLIHYRPLETNSLRKGEIPARFEGDPAARFFQVLLRRLEDRLGRTHLLALSEEIAATPPAESQSAPLHLFGLSYLPPLHLDILRGFSREREMHAYLISPFENFVDKGYFKYAEDDELSEVFHPLLAAWGSLGTDFLHRLYDDAEGVHDVLVEFQEGHDVPVEFQEEDDHLLARLRSDIRKVKTPSVFEGDNWNIEIHSTFGMLRQVEALRDRILHLIDDDPTLRPRDIVILTPDPARFGPLIEAVFGQHEANIPAIPVTLTDNSLASLSEAGSLLIQLFELANVRVTLPGLAGLFELRGLSSRFNIPEEEQGALREILAESMMRCHYDLDDPGIDKDIPVSAAHTIRAGLRRILLGSLMRDPEENDPDEEIVRDYLPLTGIDADRLELVHQILNALDAVLGLIPELRKPKSLDDWLRLIARVFEELLPPNDLGAEGVLYQLGQLRLESDYSLSSEEAPLLFDASAFAYEIERRLDDSSDHPVGRRGGVVVSRLTPMRALPFRVIALLGLDEATFPRRARHRALDLVAKKSQPGDRVAGREDRHLLFEALLAARDRLMIFYTGRDATNNESIPPSVPVAELLDVLRVMNGERERELIVEHPLHPFSEALFAKNVPDLLRPLSMGAFQAAQALGGEKQRAEVDVEMIRGAETPEQGIVEIDLDDLIRFFDDPAKGIAKRSLKIALPGEAATLEDREPLQLDGLEKWNLRNPFVEALLQGEKDHEELKARIERRRKSSGKGLPFGLEAQDLSEASALIPAYDAVIGGQPEKIALRGRTIRSEDGAIYQINGGESLQLGDELMFITASGNSKRETLRAWLRLAFTEGHSMRARAVCHEASDASEHTIELKAAPSDEHLLRLIRVYLGTDTSRFAVPIAPAFAVAKDLNNDKPDAEAMKSGDKAYTESSHSGREPEFENPANVAVYHSSPFDPSSPFYKPALELIKDLHVHVFAATSPTTKAKPKGKG